jgi:hypothetical protein
VLRANFDARDLVSAMPVGFPIFLNANRTEAKVFVVNAVREDAEPAMHGAAARPPHVAAERRVPLPRYEWRVERQHRVFVD